MKCRLDLEDNGAVLPLAEGGGGANLPNLASCLDEGDPRPSLVNTRLLLYINVAAFSEGQYIAQFKPKYSCLDQGSHGLVKTLNSIH